MSTPQWALSLSFWLHMVATVTWVGGLTTLSLIVIPAAKKTLTPEDFPKFLSALNKKLDPIAWFGLVLLTITGLVQMSANPNYEGFLAFNNDWSKAILIKHIFFLGIIGLSAYQTWSIAPKLEREAIKQLKGLPTNQSALHTKVEKIIRLNMILGILVLLLTSLARVA